MAKSEVAKIGDKIIKAFSDLSVTDAMMTNVGHYVAGNCNPVVFQRMIDYNSALTARRTSLLLTADLGRRMQYEQDTLW